MPRDLFSPEDPPASQKEAEAVPLAERMRPRNLQEVVGQDHLLGEGRILRSVIDSDEIPSMIFWGPPGAGKTTLARVIAAETKSHFVALSAVLSGVKDVKSVVEEAQVQRKGFNRRTILFIDEIHRFNRAQQDAFLPHVEKGTIVLVGATTENPSFEVISPLLSRTRVLVLEPLQEFHLLELLRRALADRERGFGNWGITVGDQELRQIAGFSSGDARVALNALEIAARLARGISPENPEITPDLVREALQKRTLLYDKAGEEHYNLISALHKSLRNSDADASLYWLGRMLEAGEDPLYLARRMVRFASEDVGLADPGALGRAIDAMRAVHFLGLPEGKLALAQLAVYLAQAPKSNALYEAYGRVQRDIEASRAEPVPLHLRNAPTGLMKELGYGEGYRYAHHEANRIADIECLPGPLAGRTYYRPTGEGFEAEVARRLKRWKELKNRR
jgi:putative ATPase